MNAKKLLPVLVSAALLCACGSSVSSAEKDDVSAVYPTAFPNGNNAGAINLEFNVPDMSGYKFLSDANPAFLEVTMEESLRLVEEGGTGLVFYSYEDCPWCNRAIPILNQAAKEEGVQIFYVDIYADEFEAKSKEEQEAIINRLYTEMEPALEHKTDEDTGKTSVVLQVPLLAAVKDGSIIGHHLGVTDDFELDQDNLDEFQVTEDQKNELLAIYEQLIEETYA